MTNLAAATALQFLLTAHLEVDELPFAWTIDKDRVIRPFITVAHDRGEESLRLLAAALELDVRENSYESEQHGPMMSLSADGRWGGAEFDCVAYVRRSVSEAVVRP